MDTESPKPIAEKLGSEHDPELAARMAATDRMGEEDKRRNRRGKWIFFGGLVIALLLIGYTVNRRMNLAYASSSCANHFIQLRASLSSMAFELKPTDPPVILPPGGPDSMALQKFLGQAFGQACPESLWRDGSMGYVYIGEGLNLLDVETKRIPILFCPGENHRGSREHSHCYRGGWDICVRTNAEILTILQDALKRGEAGDIAYSKKSLETLRQEIRKRQN